MRILAKAVMFLIVCGAGYLTYLLLPYGMVFLDIQPDITIEPARSGFRNWYLIGNLLAFIAGTGLATGFFFERGALRLLLLFMPILTPLVFGSAVFAYFILS